MAKAITADAVTEAAETGLEKFVAKWVTETAADGYGGDPRSVFKDLFYGGCESGQVGELVYYKDTVAFALKYMEDILKLAEEEHENYGDTQNLWHYLGTVVKDKYSADTVDTALNWLAWYGFETAARKLADRVGYDD